MNKVFSKQAVIGFITIISLIVLYLGLNHLKGVNVFQPSNYYYVSISNVSGLHSSSPVFVDGFKVGIIKEIEYDFDRADRIIVQIGLDKSMKVQTGSYAELKSDLTAGASLDLKLNKYVSSYYIVGDTIEGVAGAGLMDKISSEVMPQIETILPRLDSILMGIQVLVNHPALSQSLTNIEKTTAALNQSSVQLNRLLSNDIPVIATNLNKISSDFAVVGENMKQLDLKTTLSTVDSVMTSLNQVSQQLKNPNSSLGLLLNDRTFYDHLDSTTVNASKLLLDLKENPKRYVHFSLF